MECQYPSQALKEILSDFNAAFRFETVEQIKSIYVIRIDTANQGEIVTKDSINEIEEKKMLPLSIEDLCVIYVNMINHKNIANNY